MSVVVTQSGDGQMNRTATEATSEAMQATLQAEIGPAVLPSPNEQTAPIVPRLDDPGDAETETPDDADDAETEVETETAAPDPPDTAPRKKSGAQRNRERIERLEQSVREAQAEVQRWRSQPPPAAPLVQDPGTPPQVDDFETYEDFIDARATFRARAALAEMQAQQATDAAQQYAVQQQSALQAGFRAKLADAQVQYADWHETVGTTTLHVHPVVGDEIQRLEHGPDIMRWLALHPEEHARIHQMPTADDARRALNRLDGQQPWGPERSAPARTVPSRTVSQAPPPVTPGVPQTSLDVTALDIARLPAAGTGDSFRQYKQWAQKQQGGSR